MPYVRRPADIGHLSQLAQSLRMAEEAVTEEVARLRYEGASWLDIAEGLGTTRQNAWRKYRNFRWDAETEQAVADGEI